MRRSASFRFPTSPLLFLSLVGLAVVMWPATRTARASDSRVVGLAGNDKFLWLFHRRAEPDGALLLYFASRRGGEDAPKSFRPLFRMGVTGAVGRAVAHGNSLHVFFRDGTHRRYSRRVAAWEALSSPVQSVERSLPRSGSSFGIPLAVASNASQSVLYAVITAQQARELAGEQARAQAFGNAAHRPNDNRASSSPDSPEQPTTSFPTDTYIVRYVSGRWHLDRPGPVELSTNSTILAMLARDGAIHLIYEDKPAEGKMVDRVSLSAATTWSDSVPVPLADLPACSAACWIDDQATVLLARRHREGITASLVRLEDGVWVAGPTLVDSANAPARFSSPLALAVFDGSAVVAAVENGQDMKVGRWSLDQGKPLEAMKAARAHTDRPPQLVPRSTRMLLEYVILGGILAAVFMWRRGGVVLAIPLESHRCFAPLPRRAMALALDLAILVPAWGLALYFLWVREGLTWVEFIAERARQDSGGVGALDLFPAVAGLILALYATIFEAAIGATPGKRFAGLHVVGHDGKRCKLGTIVVRNLMRVIEFEFLPLVLLVAFTPGRQRLGDILARTVVVASTDLSPHKSSSQPSSGTMEGMDALHTEDTADDPPDHPAS